MFRGVGSAGEVVMVVAVYSLLMFVSYNGGCAFALVYV